MWVWSVKNSDSNGRSSTIRARVDRVDALVGREVADGELHGRPGHWPGSRPTAAEADERRVHHGVRAREAEGVAILARAAARTRARSAPCRPASRLAASTRGTTPRCGPRARSPRSTAGLRAGAGSRPDATRRSGTSISSPAFATRSSSPTRKRSSPSRSRRSARPGSGGGASAAACRRARTCASTTSRSGRRLDDRHRLARGQLQRLGHVNTSPPASRSLVHAPGSRWRSRARRRRRASRGCGSPAPPSRRRAGCRDGGRRRRAPG